MKVTAVENRHLEYRIVDTSKESPAGFVTLERGEFPGARKNDDCNGYDRYDYVDNLGQAGFKR